MQTRAIQPEIKLGSTAYLKSLGPLATIILVIREHASSALDAASTPARRFNSPPS